MTNQPPPSTKVSQGPVPEAVSKEIEALGAYRRSMIGAAQSSEHGSGYNTGRADGARMGIQALQRVAAYPAISFEVERLIRMCEEPNRQPDEDGLYPATLTQQDKERGSEHG